jgi:hypothetical protein
LECSSLSTPGSSVNGSPSTCVSAAATFGLVAAIGSRVSKALTQSAIATIPHCIRSSVVSVDAWNLWNVLFMDMVVLLNVSFMDAVNDSIMCIISLNCLSVTKTSSSSSGSCCGGCFLRGMISGIEKCSSRWLALARRNQRLVVSHTLSSVLPRSYECSTYAVGGNRWL